MCVCFFLFVSALKLNDSCWTEMQMFLSSDSRRGSSSPASFLAPPVSSCNGYFVRAAQRSARSLEFIMAPLQPCRGEWLSGGLLPLPAQTPALNSVCLQRLCEQKVQIQTVRSSIRYVQTGLSSPHMSYSGC